MTTKLRYRAILAQKTVGVAGCGGLGSNCAMALARAGVGTIVIADFDVVSEDNLDRQYYFRHQIGMPKAEALAGLIQAVDPAIKVTAHTVRIVPELVATLFAGCDLLIEAFDDSRQKVMLLDTALRRLPDIPVIAASGLAGWGGSETIRIVRSKGLIMVGDQTSEVSDTLPPTAGRVAVVANIQANEALALLLGPVQEFT